MFVNSDGGGAAAGMFTSRGQECADRGTRVRRRSEVRSAERRHQGMRKQG